MEANLLQELKAALSNGCPTGHFRLSCAILTLNNWHGKVTLHLQETFNAVIPWNCFGWRCPSWSKLSWCRWPTLRVSSDQVCMVPRHFAEDQDHWLSLIYFTFWWTCAKELGPFGPLELDYVGRKPWRLGEPRFAGRCKYQSAYFYNGDVESGPVVVAVGWSRQWHQAWQQSIGRRDSGHKVKLQAGSTSIISMESIATQLQNGSAHVALSALALQTTSTGPPL